LGVSGCKAFVGITSGRTDNADNFDFVGICSEEMLVAQAFLDTGDIGDIWRQLATFLFLSPAATGDNSKQQPFLGLL